MIDGHQTRHDPHKDRHFKPQRLHADKAYDRADLRTWLRWKRIGVRIARKGIESSEPLGRRRWVIERTMSWLSGYRRLSPATNAIPTTTWPFSASPPPSAATSGSSASPRRTRSWTSGHVGTIPAGAGGIQAFGGAPDDEFASCSRAWLKREDRLTIPRCVGEQCVKRSIERAAPQLGDGQERHPWFWWRSGDHATTGMDATWELPPSTVNPTLARHLARPEQWDHQRRRGS